MFSPFIILSSLYFKHKNKKIPRVCREVFVASVVPEGEARRLGKEKTDPHFLPASGQ